MPYKYTPASIREKNVHELTFEELAFIHLSTNASPLVVKTARLRSTLSFIYENIQHSLSYEKSKDLLPYLAMCAILDQIGICYDRKDRAQPRFGNGIKRALVLFGEIDENDEVIEILYAFRNGLIHNISLTSHAKNDNKYFLFSFSEEISDLHKSAELDWNGNYEILDGKRSKYTTVLNTKKFRELVNSCIQKANELNEQDLLSLRLPGGNRQFFYDYIRGVDHPTIEPDLTVV